MIWPWRKRARNIPGRLLARLISTYVDYLMRLKMAFSSGADFRRGIDSLPASTETTDLPIPAHKRLHTWMESTLTSAPIALSGRKILVVDDDRLNLRIIGGILRGEGYVLAEGNSGERALELYAEFKPDLVLLDVMMPGIDGFETCRSRSRRRRCSRASVRISKIKRSSSNSATPTPRKTNFLACVRMTCAIHWPRFAALRNF